MPEILGAAASFSQTPAPQDPPAGAPEASIDLATSEGLALVQGQWRYGDTKIVETDFPGPGADNQPTGPVAKTLDYTLDNMVTYKKTLASKHRIDATLLYSVERNRVEDDSTKVSSLPYEAS